jgi:small-conductance mechanosensitive channel
MKPFLQHVAPGKILLRALKWPLLLFVIGFCLANLNLIRGLEKNITWQQIITIAATTGHIFMSVSWVLFIYVSISSALQIYQQSVETSLHKTALHVAGVFQKALKFLFVFFAFRAVLAVLDINPKEVAIIHQVISIFIIAAIAWLVLQIISTFELVAYNKYATESGSRDGVNNYTRIHLIRNILVVLVIVVAFAAGLMVFDSVRNIGISLLASAGFLTAILGLAAQQSLSSLLSGIQFAFAQPFQIGDIITVETETGTIEEITLMYVKLKTGNLQQLTLPITYFLQKPFRNWSFYNEGIRGEIKQTISAKFPLNLVRDELNKIAQASSGDGRKIQAINIADFNENTVQLGIIISAETLSALEKFKSSLREKLFEFIRSSDRTEVV